MPTLIVYEMGRNPRPVRVDKDHVVVGRDESCDVVLPNASVSRLHANLFEGTGGAWSVAPLSPENPVFVDGRPVGTPVAVAEGQEMQIGCFMVVLSHQDDVTGYLGADSHYRVVCNDCHWKGTFSSANKAPLCPECGGFSFFRTDPFATGAAQGRNPGGGTDVLRSSSLHDMAARLRLANRARIERITPLQGAPAYVDLPDDEVTVFGYGSVGNVRLSGIGFGTVAEMHWTGEAWAIRAKTVLPSMTIAGESVREAVVEPGTEIELVKNRFRFVLRDPETDPDSD